MKELLKNKKKLALFVLAASAVLYVFVVQPRMEPIGLDEDIAARYKQLVKYRAMAAQKDAGGDVASDMVAEREAYEKRFLAGPNASLGFAELQSVVGRHARDAGLELMAIKPLARIEKGEFVEIPLQAELRGNMQAFTFFVKRIEAENLGLRVSKLSLSLVNIREPDNLNVKIAIHGIMKL